MNKILFGILFLTVVSCGTKDVAETIPAVADEAIAAEVDEFEIIEDDLPTERPVYHETETILTDLVHTKLEVNFIWEKSQMNGVATITAKPHFYPSDSLILDAKAMLINSVKMGGKDLKYTYADDYLKIKLDKEYTRNDKYTVVIDYVARPEEREAGGSAAIMSDKGLYFINPTGEEKGKMPQIWTQGETESSSIWFPTIDSPNAKTTQEIFITVDEKYVTLSNGKLITSKKLSDGKRVDHWKQDLPHAPYLFMMGVGEFKVVHDFYTRQDGSKMEVNYYVEPEWESSAKDIFGETPEMIKFFSEKLGVEYAWDKYHQIVVRDYVSGAMENTGAVIFGDFVYKNKRELIDGNDQSTIAHELFHHWFGDLVTCESWSNLTLNESFANYSQYLWDEYKFGLDEADYQAENEKDGYFQSAQMQGYHDLVWFDYDDKEEMFDGHSYNKGGRILHMLRNYLGDDAFFAGINKYLVDNKFKAAEFHQLRLAFEEVSGKDLNWFFEQWYLGSMHPVLTFRQDFNAENGEVTISVTQDQNLEEAPIFKIPLNLAIYDNDGKHIYPIVIDELEETYTFPVKGEVKGIMYDDQQMLLAKSEEQKTTEQYIFQYYNHDRYMSRKIGLEKGSRDRGEAGQKLVLDALQDPFWEIRETAIKKMSKLKDDFEEEGVELLKKMATEDSSSDVRAEAVKRLKKYLGNAELEAMYKDRIKNDQSYTVVTQALNSYGKLNSSAAMEIAKELENEHSSKMIAGVVSLYASSGDESKFDFIYSALTGDVVQGFDKLGVLNMFTQYLSKTGPDLAEKAYDVYEDQGNNGSFYMKMFIPQNVDYLVNQFGVRITQLENDIKKHEENGDVALADHARSDIKKYNALIEKYSALSEELSKNSRGRLIVHEEDEE